MTLRVLLVFVALHAGCGGGFCPDSISWDGRMLEKENFWEFQQFGGVVYVPPGQTLEAADVQLGFIVSSESSPPALSNWIMEQYRQAPGLTRYHETVRATAACKVGLTGQRPFLAVHVCGTHPEEAAICIEEDQHVNLGELCPLADKLCWERQCRRRIDSVGPKLDSLRQTAFGNL